MTEPDICVKDDCNKEIGIYKTDTTNNAVMAHIAKKQMANQNIDNEGYYRVVQKSDNNTMIVSLHKYTYQQNSIEVQRLNREILSIDDSDALSYNGAPGSYPVGYFGIPQPVYNPLVPVGILPGLPAGNHPLGNLPLSSPVFPVVNPANVFATLGYYSFINKIFADAGINQNGKRIKEGELKNCSVIDPDKFVASVKILMPRKDYDNEETKSKLSDLFIKSVENVVTDNNYNIIINKKFNKGDADDIKESTVKNIENGKIDATNKSKLDVDSLVYYFKSDDKKEKVQKEKYTFIIPDGVNFTDANAEFSMITFSVPFIKLSCSERSNTNEKMINQKFMEKVVPEFYKLLKNERKDIYDELFV